MRREVNTVDELGEIVGHLNSYVANFVHVIDDTTIAIPERPGNKRVDGYQHALQRPY
jgi:uncharacterized protein